MVINKLLLFSTVVILIFSAAPALAAPTTDSFSATIFPDEVQGDGTGYDGGTWYYYPNTGWWNQWFYDDPLDTTRCKEITYHIEILDGFSIGDVMIVINWSTLAYPPSGPDGPPPIPPINQIDEELWISREYVVYDGPVEGTMSFADTFIITDYNPEWVSIDIMSLGYVVLPITIVGTITHECIPAPGAILLGSIGVGLVGWLRKRRTI